MHGHQWALPVRPVHRPCCDERAPQVHFGSAGRLFRARVFPTTERDMSRVNERFPATDRKILRKLDEGAVRQIGIGVTASVLSFIAIVWIGEIWRSLPRMTVVFGGLVLLSTAAQAALMIFFENLYPRAPRRWRRQFSFLLIVRATVWSAFIVALLVVARSSDLALLALFLTLTLSAALAATWFTDVWTVRIYLLVALAPPMLGFMAAGRADALLVAAFIAGSFYALLRVSEQQRHLFWRAFARREPEPASVPVTGNMHARFLLRAAEEMRQPLAIASDALAVAENEWRPELQRSARRAALQLVERLEVMDDAARLLRSEKVPQPEAGTTRRRLEEVADDIGLVAADIGVLCTTWYDPRLPERVKLDFDLQFRALRILAGWTLEQMPSGSELLLRFELAEGQHEDRLRCVIDVRSLHLQDALRNGLDRAGQGNALADPEVPLPLAVVAEIGRLQGGGLLLAGRQEERLLALEAVLEAVEAAERDSPLRQELRGRTLLLAGGTPAQQSALEVELEALEMTLACCAVGDDVPAQAQAADAVLVLVDARDPAKAVAVSQAFRETSSNRRLCVLAPGGEAPVWPEGEQRPPEWLRLPLGRRRLRAALSRAAGIDAAATAHMPTGLRVLVAEDNKVNQMVARSMLEKLACEVEVVSDGAAAVERLKRGGIGLVLMDCEMPGIDGPEATRQIRAREAEQGLPRLPIVAMTAHTAEHDVAGFLAAGMDDSIPKPVSLASLASRIERFRPRH